MPKTDSEPAPRDQTGLVAAFQSVTEGVTDLALTHLELAKAEARRDVKVYGKEAARAGAGLGIALLGFGLINLAIVCLAGYLGGLASMALTSAILGGMYTYAGGVVASRAMRRMQEREGAMSTTKDEIKRSTEWAKQIKESS